MLSDYGFFLLLLCCVTSCYGVVASLLAALLRHRLLLRSAQMASLMTAVLCVSASILLWFFLFNRDYSVSYVFKNSSNDLPWRYTLSAFWSALEGSHLLWTLLLSIFAAVATWTYSADNEHLIPYVSATLQGILAAMFILAITYSDPFKHVFPVPADGLGMNALLQNPYMMIHPPLLFTGYTGCAIPFAYAIAALCFGDVTSGWLRTVRRWALLAWCALSAGIFLGGRWAYVELGWAGYWAWDPVENSSLMPWIFTTALLHALLVQEKIGHLKRLSIALAGLAFFFSFFGTFITRSGVISSVHSFAQSPIGPAYLTFLFVLMVVMVGLYGLRAPSLLPANSEKVWGISRESALVITQFLLIIFALIIFIGTIYPIVSEWITGNRFNVQAPYFNTFAPYLGFAFIVAIVLGNLLRYQTGKVIGNKRFVFVALFLALVPTVAFAYFGRVFASTGFRLGVQFVGIWLCFWGTLCLVYEAIMHIRSTRVPFGLFLRRNFSYVGALIAHLGLLVGILGFLGNYRGAEKTATLQTGEDVELLGYRFHFKGLSVGRDENMHVIAADVDVSRDGSVVGSIHPARAKYPTKDELYHEVGINSGFWHDIYAVLSDFDAENKNRATIQLNINPTVRLVWLCALLLVFGGFLCIIDRVRGRVLR